jgi:hypothetical protein
MNVHSLSNPRRYAGLCVIDVCFDIPLLNTGVGCDANCQIANTTLKTQTINNAFSRMSRLLSLECIRSAYVYSLWLIVFITFGL